MCLGVLFVLFIPVIRGTLGRLEQGGALSSLSAFLHDGNGLSTMAPQYIVSTTLRCRLVYDREA